MKKYLVALCLASAVVVPQAHALMNFELDQNLFVVPAPTSGVTTIDFTGTITLTDGWFLNGFTFYLPVNETSGDFLSGTFDAGFLTWYSAQTPTYTGAIFHLNVLPTSLGLYDFNGGTTDGTSQMIAYGQNASGSRHFADSEIVSVEVTPTPEPASMAVLGVGVAALLRRRKKA